MYGLATLLVGVKNVLMWVLFLWGILGLDEIVRDG